MTQQGPETPTAEMQAPEQTQAQQPERKGGWRKIAAGFVAGAILLGGAVGIYKITEGGEDETDPTAIGSRDELKDLLTITAEDVDRACLDFAEQTGTASVIEVNDDEEIVQPKVNGILPVKPEIRTQDNRLWSDAIANPTTSDQNDKEALEREFGVTLCEDPVVASMAANYFANMEVDGVKVVELNPWLKKYQGPASGISQDAQDLLPSFGKQTLTDEELDQTLAGIQDHEELAEKLMAFIDNFANDGVQEHTTVLNYHQVAGSLTVGQMPNLELNPYQYNGKFLTFQLTAKDGRCMKVMLVNVDDQRIAETLTCVSAPEGLPPIDITVPTTPNTTPETTPKTVPDKVLYPTPGPGGSVIMPPITGAPVADTGPDTQPVGDVVEPVVPNPAPDQDPQLAPGGNTGGGTPGTIAPPPG